MLYYADLRLVLSAKNSLTTSVKSGFPKKDQWVYCYRRGLQINTNMYAKAFHRVFKQNYLKGKVNKRVDACLVNLVKCARDMGFDRLIKITKGKLTYRMSMICVRHKQSLLLRVESVEHIDDGKWKVLSENGKTFYEVTESVQLCPGKEVCKIACTQCHLCVHSFTCTCPDSIIMSTICKYIHLVKCSILHDPSQPPSDDKGDISMDCPQQEIENILTCIRSHPDDIGSSKCRIKGMFLQIMEEVDQCTLSAALKQLEKQMRVAHSLFVSLKDKKEQQVIPLKNNVDAPANKSMETQPRFYSTKKRWRKAKVRLAGPTFEEQEVFLKELSNENMEQDFPVTVDEGI